MMYMSFLVTQMSFSKLSTKNHIIETDGFSPIYKKLHHQKQASRWKLAECPLFIMFSTKHIHILIYPRQYINTIGTILMQSRF